MDRALSVSGDAPLVKERTRGSCKCSCTHVSYIQTITRSVPMDNLTIAQRLIGKAHELEGERSNLYRIRAYRRAAETVLNLRRPVEEIVAEAGRRGLRDLPGIGASLSEKVVCLVETGR